MTPRPTKRHHQEIRQTDKCTIEKRLGGVMAGWEFDVTLWGCSLISQKGFTEEMVFCLSPGAMKFPAGLQYCCEAIYLIILCIQRYSKVQGNANSNSESYQTIYPRIMPKNFKVYGKPPTPTLQRRDPPRY